MIVSAISRTCVRFPAAQRRLIKVDQAIRPCCGDIETPRGKGVIIENQGDSRVIAVRHPAHRHLTDGIPAPDHTITELREEAEGMEGSRGAVFVSVFSTSSCSIFFVQHPRPQRSIQVDQTKSSLPMPPVRGKSDDLPAGVDVAVVARINPENKGIQGDSRVFTRRLDAGSRLRRLAETNQGRSNHTGECRNPKSG